MLNVAHGTTVRCLLGTASLRGNERFPGVFVHVQGDRGSVELAPDARVWMTTAQGTALRRRPRPCCAWVVPRDALARAGIVPRDREVSRSLRREG
jgi:hypothetical protein